MNKLVSAVLVVSLMMSCGQEKVYLPKPRLFPQVNLPEKGYQEASESDCPFTFTYPTYGSLNREEYFKDEDPVHSCWFDLTMKEINASIHFSYIPVNDRPHFDELVNDAFRMVTEHNQKADGRRDSLFRNKHDVEGLLFDIEGDVATPIQFFMTDSTSHFLRASLYFDDKVDADSIAPVLRFVRTDIDTLIESFQWKF